MEKKIFVEDTAHEAIIHAALESIAYRNQGITVSVSDCTYGFSEQERRYRVNAFYGDRRNEVDCVISNEHQIDRNTYRYDDFHVVYNIGGTWGNATKEDMDNKIMMLKVMVDIAETIKDALNANN